MNDNRVLFEGRAETVKAYEKYISSIVCHSCSVTSSDADLPISPKIALAAQ